LDTKAVEAGCATPDADADARPATASRRCLQRCRAAGARRHQRSSFPPPPQEPPCVRIILNDITRTARTSGIVSPAVRREHEVEHVVTEVIRDDI